jgi:hypothetical protein
MKDAARLRDVEIERIQDDVHIRGRLPQSWRRRAGFPSE